MGGRLMTAIVLRVCGLALAASIVLQGCRQDMFDQPRYKPFAASPLFADGTSARPPVEGTVSAGDLHGDALFDQGMVNNAESQVFPVPVTTALIRRGRERFDIYCAPCHGLAGDGDGVIPQHGFPPPPTYHQDRLRAAPPGHFVSVIRNGFGAMFAYGDRVGAYDRWAVAAYIKTLQFARYAPVGKLPPEDQQKLPKAPSP
jgi:mono/diheme cytochrome c family protein